MRRNFFLWSILLVAMASCTATKQPDLAGDWAGTLNIAGTSLRLIFHISDTANGPSTVVESVDQQNAMIPAVTIIDGDSVSFFVESLNVEYVATIMGDTIVGEFSQLGNSMPDFTISRNR